MPFAADSLRGASADLRPGKRGAERADGNARAGNRSAGVMDIVHMQRVGKGGRSGSPLKALKTSSIQKTERDEADSADILEGIAVYCDDGAGKRTCATLRFEDTRDAFVCSIQEDNGMVTDYSVNDFCQIAGPKPQPSHLSNGETALNNTAALIMSANSGAPVNWAQLEKAVARQRHAQPSGAGAVSAQNGRLSWHGNAAVNDSGSGSRRNSGTSSRHHSQARGTGSVTVAKRRRDGGGSDSDSDGEIMWAKALKASEYLERLEKQETYKQRRQAEQAALNQRFFEPSRKREEPVLGVDISLPLLPEGMFSSRDESSLLEKGKAVHARLIEKGEETEEDRHKHDQWVTRYNLVAESERLQKVSREFSKSGIIQVNMYKEVPHATEDHFDPTVTKKWNEDFYAVSWLKMAKVNVEVQPLTINTPRSRSLSGNAARGGSSKLDFAAGMSNGLHLRDMDQDDFDETSYHFTIEPEERQLLEALFACYGPDHRTICRLLCRPDAHLEVQDLVAEAAADIRCEVCRNPEGEDLMILCDSCDKGYHIFCLDPPLPAIPEGDWFCEHCTAGSNGTSNEEILSCESEDRNAHEQMPHLSIDGCSLQLHGLEVEAKEELQQSVADGEWTKIIKRSVLQGDAHTDSISKLQGRLTMEEIQLCPNTSIFSAMLFTCPIPTRNENKSMADVVTVPLRRHLRIIAAAVKAAFDLMLINCVRRNRKRLASGLIIDEPLKAARRGWLVQMSPQLIDIEECARKEGAINVLLRRHSNLIKVGDRVFIWKTGGVQMKDGLWEPTSGGLVAVGQVRTAPEMQALPAGMAAHLRKVGRQLDPWKETVSCSVAISHVLQEELEASKLRTQLQGRALPIFDNAVGSVYRLTTVQITAIEELMQRHDPSISAETFIQLSGSSSGRGQHAYQGERKDKPATVTQRRSLNHTQDSSEESDGNDLYEEGEEPANGKPKRPMWMNQGEQLLLRLKRHRDAKPFLLPVNTVLYPDYESVLSANGLSPVSLADIEANLESGTYRNHKEFITHIKRIWKNCVVYNGEKSPMQFMATNMSQEADLLWANFKKHRNKRRRVIQEQREDEEEGQEDDNQSASSRPVEDAGETMEIEGVSPVRSKEVTKDSVAACPDAKMADGKECNGNFTLPQCSVCNGTANAVDFVFCNASGAGSHFACLRQVPEQLLDGPFICPQVLKGLEKWQYPCAPNPEDEIQVRPCRICKESRDDLPVRSCSGCYTRYHTKCLESRESSPSVVKLGEDKNWLCFDCQTLLPSSKHKQYLLRALVRREIVYECRRLIHLHCELCSRDRELDMERELHRFRVLKLTAALATRIFQYNALLMREANDLLLHNSKSFLGPK